MGKKKQTASDIAADMKKTAKRVKKKRSAKFTNAETVNVNRVAETFKDPSTQYIKTTSPDWSHNLSGAVLVSRQHAAFRLWAIVVQNSLPDSTDWQFGGVSNGQINQKEINIPTLTARYLYRTLNLAVYLTWPLSQDESLNKVGVRVVREDGKSRSSYVKPDDMIEHIRKLLQSEYKRIDADNERVGMV